jgi:hypothetical protein
MFRRKLAAPVGSSLPWRPMWWRRAAFAGTVVAWACRRAYRLARFGWRHRYPLVVVTLAASLWWVMDVARTQPRKGVILLLLLACLSWSYAQPAERPNRLRAWWRYATIYRREFQPAMTLAGLAHGSLLPKLERVEIDGPFDVVTVRPLPGQVPQDYMRQRERLATVFGASSCEVLVFEGRSDRLVLEFAVPGRTSLPGVNEPW